MKQSAGMELPVNFNVMVGGEAGQGVQSAGFLLAKIFARSGYHVFADQDYESRVRGGHNFYRVRVSDIAVGAIAEQVDMLIALNKESVDLHRDELATGGVIIVDGENVRGVADSPYVFNVPLDRLAEENAGNKVMANSVAFGVVLGLLRHDFTMADELLRAHFGAGDTGANNVKAAKAGYDYARQNFKREFAHRLDATGNVQRMLLNGNEAIALGALAAGCKFVAAYPMTPTSSIMEYLAARAKDYGMVVFQPEDEIAAINMIIGAGYAGARSMTATSGGGFCLMVEGLGLAGMTETPIVVVEGQRAGPAIGLPTRTEQGDLEFILHASHGEFPRAVLAPCTIEDAFWLTVKAFNLADRYQLPVIVITDQHLASSYATVDTFDISKVTIDRGLLYTESGGGDYKRHLITGSGVSPRAFPLQGKSLVVTDSDEHDESGHLIEDAETRKRMMEKRLRKLDGLRQEVAAPQVYGMSNAMTTLIGWGSTCNAIREAVDIVSRKNVSINAVNLSELYPLPADALAGIMDNAGKVYVIENNATGQLAHFIRAETGKKATGNILRYDGRPLTPAYIVRELEKEMSL
jgi:2-oxoglutarate ferredoxin oxidoreductase subunit alpha